MSNKTAIVIGAGIVGLAMARALAIRGFSVKVFDRSHRAVGASIRNFGMIWPIGQPEGKLYNRAIRSRNVWKDVTLQAGIWCEEAGSIHVAYHQDEWSVLQELYASFLDQGRQVSLLSKDEILKRTDAVVPAGLLGGLYSTEELILDPREAMNSLPGFLSEKYPIEFHWGRCVSYICDQTIYIGNEEEHEADLIFVCSGPDLETLYPDAFTQLPITKCKLQMMRLVSQPDNWRMGSALCGGLSLIHYASFRVAEGLPALRRRFEEELPEYLKLGIHVMVSQNGSGELTIGDSHEYGLTHDPFDKDEINALILNYLRGFARLKDWAVVQTWNGIYPVATDGKADIFFSPDPYVYVVNCVGGAGMTSSFGLAEELAEAM